MVKMRIAEILKEQSKTKYWLRIQMDGISYQNLSKIINNETKQIRFDTLDKLSTVLNVPIGELFEKTDEEDKKEK